MSTRMMTAAATEAADARGRPAPAAPVYLDLSGVRSAAARAAIERRVEHLGLEVETVEGTLERIGSGATLRQTAAYLVVVGDLSRLVSSFVRAGTSWPAAWSGGRASLIACVRGRRDQSHAALVDDLMRSTGPRMTVCDYDDTAVLDRCLTQAFAAIDPRAVIDVRVSPGGTMLWVEFGDGLADAIPWAELGLARVEPRLLPETAALGEDPFSIEVLDAVGDTFEIDAAVVRALVDEDVARRIAREASAADERLGSRLRAKRVERDLTQEALGRRARLQQSLISKLENGQHQPTYATLEKYAAGLDLDVAELLA